MLSTYQMFQGIVEKEYLQKDHNFLAALYKTTNQEYVRSQIIGAIFIKSFEMLLKESNQYKFDSSDKAGLALEEILSAIQDWDIEKSAFFTYLTVRIHNKFLWEFTSVRAKQNKLDAMCGLSLDEEIRSSGDEASNATYADVIADNSSMCKLESGQIFDDINKMFDTEIIHREAEEKYRKENGLKSLSRKESAEYIRFLRKVFDVIKDNPDYTADQIARVLGLIVKDKEGNVKMITSRTAPDVYYGYARDIDGSPVTDKWGRKILTKTVVNTVPNASYNKIFAAKHDLQDLFRLYGLAR